MNTPQELADQFINRTKQSIFLTGKAGTGKTTFLKNIVASTYKQTVIVAPTGIAALNAGGVTIHSFFQLPFAGFLPDFEASFQAGYNMKFETKKTLLRHFRMNKARKEIIQNLELLIIDEVSMLRADLLDAIDWTLRNVRSKNEPYGGVQVLFIGDLFQLPPVVKQQEWNTLRKYYAGPYFFHAKVVQEMPPKYIELGKIYRQQDQLFIEILNNLRNNTLSKENVEVLNKQVNKNFDASAEDGYITLTTHNNKADKLNASALEKVEGKITSYDAEITGNFPEHLFPIDEQLHLKEGAQVMFIKNDLGFEKQFYNGKMGKVTSINHDEITVECFEDSTQINVEKFEWENIKYTQNEKTGEVEEKVVGTFVHFPLKLAWAITVHKSQGLTFDKAVLDVSQVFAPGQAYVALSRLRSLKGLVLLSPIQLHGLKNDTKIVSYSTQKEKMDELPDQLERASRNYLLHRISASYDWYTTSSVWDSFTAAISPKSEKGKLQPWAVSNNQQIQSTVAPAKKFRNHLEKLFRNGNTLEHIQERNNAAYEYFSPTLDKVYTATLKKIGELSRVRKTVQIVEELHDLEQGLFETITQLKKTKLLLEAVVNGRSLSKEVINTEEIKNYRIAKIAKIQHELQVSGDLFESNDSMEEKIFLRKTKKKTSKTKTKKIPTHEKTFELWEGGKKIDEIAEERQLTATTIYKHIEKLIQQEKVDVDEVLGEEKLKQLNKLQDVHATTPLAEIREQLDNGISWEEARIFRAALVK